MTHGLALHNNSRRDPAGTRHRILTAAIEEFRCGGLAGARVDSIARRAQTNERMLYYYFGNKEQLFVAVVEDVYRKFAEAQAGMDLGHEAPERAMRRFARFVWEYCYSHPEVVRVINNENLQEGVHLRASGARNAMRPVITALRALLDRGAAAGVFRPGVDALHCYLAISGLGYYLVSNRFTLHAAFDRDPADPVEREHLLTLHLDMLLAYLRCGVEASFERATGQALDPTYHVPPRATPLANADDERSSIAHTAMPAGDAPAMVAEQGMGITTAAASRSSSASFFPGIAQRGEMMGVGNGDVSRVAMIGRASGALSPSAHADRAAPADSTMMKEAGGMTGPTATASSIPAGDATCQAPSPSQPPAEPASVADAAAGGRTGVFWPKSRFPSL